MLPAFSHAPLICFQILLSYLVSEDQILYLVGTHTSQLMVYNGVTLKWVAKLEYIPVSLEVGQFR